MPPRLNGDDDAPGLSGVLDEVVSTCEVGKRHAIGDDKTGPAALERNVQVARGGSFGFFREVVTTTAGAAPASAAMG